MDVSVVIPVYRSAPWLASLVERVLRVLDGTNLNYEVILIDDGSPDDAWRVIDELHHAHPDRIIAVQLMRNFGQHNALMCGFRHSQGDRVITLDDDGQHPPEEIPLLIAAMQAQGADLVYGEYRIKKQSFWRRWGAEPVHAFYQRALSTNVRPSSLRIIRRELLQTILGQQSSFVVIDGLLSWNTQRIGSVTVKHEPRAHGRSTHSLGRLCLFAFNVLTNFSLLPLHWVSIAGSATFALGLVTAGIVTVSSLKQAAPPSGAGLVLSAVLILGGTQLLALGLLGEYVGRLHLNANCKPQYIERQSVGARLEVGDLAATARLRPKLRSPAGAMEEGAL